jgi:hypothetical protein
MVPEQRFDGKQKAWCAKTALKTVRLPKGLLNRMENGWARRQTFHGLEIGAIGLDRKSNARTNGFAVPENGAGSAHTMFATNVSSRQP